MATSAQANQVGAAGKQWGESERERKLLLYESF